MSVKVGDKYRRPYDWRSANIVEVVAAAPHNVCVSYRAVGSAFRTNTDRVVPHDIAAPDHNSGCSICWPWHDCRGLRSWQKVCKETPLGEVSYDS